jgi:hypothetical protein|tara:strand:+ start:2113 stop:2292 length:180 start_codon:yes stop_codon:yes gene_type:complete
MAISRSQMQQQVSKPGMKKKKDKIIKKVISGLKKGSKVHAKQAKVLKGALSGRSKKGNR